MGEKYFRTILVVEVLGNEAFEGGLDDLHYSITEGSFSGAVLAESVTEVTRSQMGELLEMQGSSPEFLINDEDDEDTDTVEAP